MVIDMASQSSSNVDMTFEGLILLAPTCASVAESLSGVRGTWFPGTGLEAGSFKGARAMAHFWTIPHVAIASRRDSKREREKTKTRRDRERERERETKTKKRIKIERKDGEREREKKKRALGDREHERERERETKRKRER